MKPSILLQVAGVVLILLISNVSTKLTQLEYNNFAGRIIGGIETNINVIPYQVSLWNGEMHICGGALISSEWIVTAAHCLDSFSTIQIRINSSDCRQGGQLVDVIASYQHPSYDPMSYDYDVGLMKLQKFNTNGIRYARMPNCFSKKWSPNEMLTVSGWGENNIEDLTKRNLLQSVRVQFITNEKCNELYEEYEEITDRMLCAGMIGVGGKDACQGDSGGPATYKGDLIAIVSAGNNCGDANFAGIYADLTYPEIRDWIQNITKIPDQLAKCK